jgi:hypothetical protein
LYMNEHIYTTHTQSEVVPSKNGAQPHTVKRVMKHHYAVLNLATFYYAFNHLQLSVLSVEVGIVCVCVCVYACLCVDGY